jgi:hypothetical protein
MPSQNLDEQAIKNIEQYGVEKRFNYLITEVTQQQEIWILTDEHGCVMLNTEDDDCIPVWPNKEFAQSWANGDWQDCNAECITLKKWFSHWTPGLIDDELSIVSFPNHNEEGLILFPDEFEQALKKSKK